MIKWDNQKQKENVKKSLPVSIIFDVLLVLIILGSVPWNGYFGFTGFTDVFASITDFKVFKISLFNALVGQTLLAFGEWTIYSLIVLLSADIGPKTKYVKLLDDKNCTVFDWRPSKL